MFTFLHVNTRDEHAVPISMRSMRSMRGGLFSLTVCMQINKVRNADIWGDQKGADEDEDEEEY